jgi:hypothetical protein
MYPETTIKTCIEQEIKDLSSLKVRDLDFKEYHSSWIQLYRKKPEKIIPFERVKEDRNHTKEAAVWRALLKKIQPMQNSSIKRLSEYRADAIGPSGENKKNSTVQNANAPFEESCDLDVRQYISTIADKKDALDMIIPDIIMACSSERIYARKGSITVLDRNDNSAGYNGKNACWYSNKYPSRAIEAKCTPSHDIKEHRN